MRLSEMTDDQQLIKQIDDDAVAREVASRLIAARVRVTDREEALLVQRDDIQRELNKVRGECERLARQIGAYRSGDKCTCDGWGCDKCCSSDAEIRARQGIFG